MRKQKCVDKKTKKNTKKREKRRKKEKTEKKTKKRKKKENFVDFVRGSSKPLKQNSQFLSVKTKYNKKKGFRKLKKRLDPKVNEKQ